MTDLQSYRAIVDAAAFHRLLGLTLVNIDPQSGIVILRLPYQPSLSVFPDNGIYHGGVLATLADVAGSVACGVAAGRPAPTANIRIDYLKSPMKTDLITTGRVVRAGKFVSVADMEISDEDGEIYAIGRGTFSTPAQPKNSAARSPASTSAG